MDQEQLIYNYCWTGMSSSSDSLSLAHYVGKLLALSWERQPPLVAYTSHGKRQEMLMYMADTAEEIPAILLQNRYRNVGDIGPLANYDYLLLLPQQQPAVPHIAKLMAELPMLWDSFVLPPFDKLNTAYQKAVSHMAEHLELNDLEQKEQHKDKDNINNYLW